MEIVEHERDSEGEVSASGETGESHAVRIETELFGVGGKIYEGVGPVFYSYAEGILGSKSIFH